MDTPHVVIVSGPDAGRKFPLNAGHELLVGRHRDCGIVLPDTSVSRMHARFESTAEGIFLEDLDSRFGTHCNGQKITKHVKRKLESGDKLQLGRVLLEFRIRPMTDDRPQRPAENRQVPAGPTMRMPQRDQYQVLQSICLTKEEFQEPQAEQSDDFNLKRNMTMGNFSMVSLTSDGLKVAPRKAKDAPSADMQTMEDAHIKLSILYEAGKKFASTQNLKVVYKGLVDLLIKVIRAKNVLIFKVDDVLNELVPVYATGPDGEITDFSQIVYSHTLIKHCLEKREALLTSDAQEDERFSAGMSIIQFNLKSVMVIPLWTGEKILGVLQIDNNQMAGTFSENDLGFATALANQAAISIQNLILIENIRQETQIRSNLQRYLSPSIVDKIVQEKGELSLGGQKMRCNILFSDIRGFTSLSETIPPHGVVALLNEYFTEMTDVIFRYEGTLDKYIGDAIMAVFGSPYSHPDDHLRAVKAAIDMQKRLDILSERWRHEGKPIFQMGIGVGTGEAIAGNIGSLQRMEYTVIGDTVNTASRLCSIAQAKQIVIHPETAKLVENEIKLRSLGPVALKGKAEKLEVFEVVYR